MSTTWRFRLAKLRRARFLSHLDLLRTTARTFSRAGVELAHSGGFHPHPMLSFGPALAVGMESQCEYFDAVITTDVQDLVARLNAVLPQGLSLLASVPLSTSGPSLAALLNAASYRIWVNEPEELARGIIRLKGREDLVIERRNPNGSTRTIDLGSLLLEVDGPHLADGSLSVLGVTGSEGNLRPEELLHVASGLTARRILRTGIYRRMGELLHEPLSGQIVNWKEIFVLGE